MHSVKHMIFSGCVKFALGDQHTVILKPDGSVWSTAVGAKVGLAASGGTHFEQVIQSGAIAVAAGTGFTLVVKHDASVWAMGRNFRGQLGLGTKKKKRHVFICACDRWREGCSCSCLPQHGTDTGRSSLGEWLEQIWTDGRRVKGSRLQILPNDVEQRCGCRNW